MVKAGGLCSATLAAVVFLAACEKALQRTTAPPPSTQTAPVSLTLTDTPGVPAGVTVLSFQLTLMGATLQPGNVPLLSSSVQVETARLQADAMVLSTTNVAAGTYNSISFSVASPAMTVFNGSGTTISGCASGSICKFTGSTTPATVSFSGLPFPITVVANTPFGLQADIRLNNIIQSDLSFVLGNTAFIVTQLPPATATTQLEEIDDLLGQVTVVGTNQFTLQDATSLQSFTITVNGSTVFENFNNLGCTAQNFSCLIVGQIVSVDMSLLGNGTLLALAVDAEDSASQQDAEGILVSTGPLASQFSMVVLNEQPAVAGVNIGDQVQVNILSGAPFGVDADGLSVGTFTFATASDLFVGQEIQVQVTSTVPFNTSRVRLRMSQITATVSAKSGTTFTVNNLPSIFTGSLAVDTFTQTQFDPSNLTVSGLNVGDLLSLRGLLFNPTGGPRLEARKVRKRAQNL